MKRNLKMARELLVHFFFHEVNYHCKKTYVASSFFLPSDGKIMKIIAFCILVILFR